MIKDEFAPEEKQIEGINDLGFIPIKDKAPTPKDRGWFGKPVSSDYIRLQDGNFLLHSPREDADRFFAGRDADGDYVVKLSKPGVNVNVAKNSQVLFSTKVLFFQNTYSNSAVASPFTGFPPNLVMYDFGLDMNFISELNFYVESSWTITSASLHIAILVDPNGSDLPHITNGYIYLNPARSLIIGGSTNYYRYSGGTTLVTGLAPTAAPGVDETFDYALTSTQVTGIIGGWNRILIQQQTDDPGDGDTFAITLVISGYVNL